MNSIIGINIYFSWKNYTLMSIVKLMLIKTQSLNLMRAYQLEVVKKKKNFIGNLFLN